MYNEAIKASNGKKVIITETGWLLKVVIYGELIHLIQIT